MFKVTTHIAPLTRKAQLLYLTVGALVAFGLALGGLQAWLPSRYLRPPSTAIPTASVFDQTGMAGALVFFTFAGLSVALLCEATQCFVRYAFHPANTGREWLVFQYAALGVRALLALLFLAAGITLFVLWAKDPLQCGFLFCLGPNNYQPILQHLNNSFGAIISTVMFFVFVPLSFVMLYRVYTLWRLQKAFRSATSTSLEEAAFTNETAAAVPDDKGAEEEVLVGVYSPATANKSRCPFEATLATPLLNPMGKPLSMRIYKTKSWLKQLSRVVGLCVGIIVCAVLTFWLPNDPRQASALGIASYAQRSISRDTRSTNLTVPEMPYAWFRTRQLRFSDNLYLKLYPGNVFFYTYLLSAAVIVFLLRQTQTGRYWMQRRIPRCACFTFGEAAFMVATAWMVVFFLIYWIHDHNYRAAWTAASPDALKIENPERWGRGLGQLSVLFLSLLLLPIGRQSVLVTVLGVSRDGLLWFHRAIGYAMLAATVAHVIAFFISHNQYGMLWDNVRKTPIIIGRAAVRTDYTVVLTTWTTWFMWIAMGIFGLNAVRRRYYELFYYSHLAATYMALPVVVLHASAGWMYMLPGLTMFVADQLMRLWQRSAVVRVVHARKISDDTVELAFSVPGRWDMRCVHPGQYVLVCVPELTALQWHPFTLASVVEDEAVDGAGATLCTTGTVFYLHIKSMGPRTWTGRLHDLVRTGQAFSLGVEGPCGTPVDYSRYDDVVLVAGGIGASPCVSVYGSLLRAYMRSADGAGVPRVRMVWSTRSASLVGAVADMLQLPASYHGLARLPRSRTHGAADNATSAPHHNTTVEVPASHKVRDDDFALDVYVTRSGELKHFADLDHRLHEEGGSDGPAQEQREEPPVSCAAHAAEAPGAANRGARLRVYEGRPDLRNEIRSAFLDPVTKKMNGDVRRKLVLVCGPEAMVADTAAAAAEIGVAVHTEEFLF